LTIPQEQKIVNSGEQRLPRSFYTRDPIVVARELVGTKVIRRLDEAILVGRIVETEGYRGPEDRASHARPGLTIRNAPMFGPPGHAYVYLIYGIHWMFNITAHPRGVAGAVLIRALEPLEGLPIMRHNRTGITRPQLTNGPAKLAQALAIDDSLNGLDLCTGDQLYLIKGVVETNERIISGPRLRVPGDESARNRPWRFWIAGNAHVSR